jgi:hypothetical protein
MAAPIQTKGPRRMRLKSMGTGREPHHSLPVGKAAEAELVPQATPAG